MREPVAGIAQHGASVPTSGLVPDQVPGLCDRERVQRMARTPFGAYRAGILLQEFAEIPR